MNEKIKVTIGFRNGSQIEFYCDGITVNRNNLSGELVGYKIKGLDERTNPMYINISEIIYVLTSQEMSKEEILKEKEGVKNDDR